MRFHSLVNVATKREAVRRASRVPFEIIHVLGSISLACVEWAPPLVARSLCERGAFGHHCALAGLSVMLTTPA